MNFNKFIPKYAKLNCTIFDLKYIYKYIKSEYPDLDILFVTRVTSYIYVIVKPSINFLFSKESDVDKTSFTIVDKNDNTVDVVSIDLIQYCIKLKNIDIPFINSLFDEHLVVNTDYMQIVNKLINYREQLVSNCKLTLFTKLYIQLEHIYMMMCNDTNILYDELYKSKLCGIIEWACTIGGYVLQDMNYESSLKYKPDLVEMTLSKIQNNQLSIDEIKCTLSNTLNKMKENIHKITEPDNIHSIEQYLLNNVCTYCINYKHKLNLSDYKNIWFTSDLHLGHSNILKHELERWTLFGTTLYKSLCEFINSQNLSQEQIYNMSDIDFNNYKTNLCKSFIDQHDTILINKWNKVVHDDDIVFILGDFCFKKGSYANNVLSKLKGHKVLIKGNHENMWITSNTDLSQFEEVCDYMEFNYNNNSFCLSHYPFTTWNKKHYGSIQLYGHIHSNKLNNEQPNQFNVGVDVNNYTPVNIKDIIKKFKQNKGE